MTAPAPRPVEPWPIDLSGCPAAEHPSVDIDLCAQVATEILWALSGRRFGFVVIPARPVRAGRRYGFPGYWSDNGVGGLVPQVEVAGRPNEVELPGPIAEVLSVIVDGVELDPTAYHVDDWQILVRDDGNPWPRCPDVDAAADAAGSFIVIYRRGRPIPPAGLRAAAILACELAKAWADDGSCRLPMRLRTIARQGVTINLVDPNALLEKGRTGLWEVDLWLQAVNPSGLRSAPKVYRADARRPRRVGT